MPTVHFMGYVEPREYNLRVENITPIYEKDKNTDIITSYTLIIWDSIIGVECESSEVKPEYISNLWTRSLELVGVVTNLVGLKHGWSLTVHIDTFIREDGWEERLLNRGDSLSGLIDAYTLDDIDALFNEISCNVDAFMILQAMMRAISAPRMVSIECARVVDAIRYAIAPDKKPLPGWKMVHAALNADQEYIKLITDKSKSSRHGNHDFLSVDEAEQVLGRTWTLFNRYLHYSKNAPKPLPVEKFHQLHDSPKLQ